MFRRGAKSAPASTGEPRRRVCALEALEDRRLLSANPTATPALISTSTTPGIPGYTPAQVLHAYGFDTAATTLGAVGGDGAGQTIAIIEAYRSPTLATDVQQFDAQFGIPDAPSLTEVDENGGQALPAANNSWALETTLDVEWAHAVAPGANIVVVEAKSAQLSDLLTAVNTARNFSDVSVVSMSWGVDEFSGETAYDSILTTPAGHQPITFVAAVGDKGTSLNVQWPAASTNVVAVGGSTLTIDTVTTSTGVTETTYSGAVTGVSQYESPPAYQNPNPTADGRSIPDVVYDASPTPGFSIYDSAAGGWQTLGGTSAGAPQWAALVAIADETRNEIGQPTLDGASQTLPAIYLFSGTQQAANSNALATSNSGATGGQAVAGSTSALDFQMTQNAGSSYADSSGLALTNNGYPQATQVITALASTKTTAAPPSNTNASASTATPALPMAPVATPPLSKLANKTAHPFVLFAITSLPKISVAPVSVPSVGFGAAGLGFVYESTFSPYVSTPVTALTASFGGSPTLNTSGPAVVVEAVNGVATTPGINTFAQAIAAIYHSFPRIGENEVVPVTEALAAEFAGPRQSFYIAHINVTATFADAIAAFINDCAERPRSFTATENVPHDHLRAWAVTVGVVAFDAVVLGYLASRRQRRQAGHGIDRWWDETDGGTELDNRVSLL